MSRIPRRAIADLALAVSLAGLIVVGCTSNRPPTDEAPVSSKEEKPGPAESSKTEDSAKLFADWPSPVGALVISGQQDGYLEPCGCTEGQKGGLGRRFDLLQRLRTQGWPLAAIDLGSLAENPATDRGGPEEAKIKFSMALTALEAMNYDALALGAEDLKLGVADFITAIPNTLKGRPKVLSANVIPADGLDPDGFFRPSIQTTAGPIKLGITAVLDPASFAALNDDAKDMFLTFREPSAALPPILADLEKETDVQVLMVQGSPKVAEEYAKTYPGFDIVVATSEQPDPAKDPVLVNGGKTQVISVGRKGQYVGLVGFFRGDCPAIRYQRVMLGPRFKQAEPMRKLLDDDMQEIFRRARVVENYPRHPYLGGTPGASFAGAESCRACHPKTFEKWQSTKHAHAYDALLSNPRRKRDADAECVSCHVTGFRYDSGFQSAEVSAHLKGNQCENCHGPSSRHVEAPDDLDARKAIALTKQVADSTRLCLQCHDDDNSPKFKFEEDYPKIAHKGLDRYADPAVHRGAALKPAP